MVMSSFLEISCKGRPSSLVILVLCDTERERGSLFFGGWGKIHRAHVVQAGLEINT